VLTLFTYITPSKKPNISILGTTTRTYEVQCVGFGNLLGSNKFSDSIGWWWSVFLPIITEVGNVPQQTMIMRGRVLPLKLT